MCTCANNTASDKTSDMRKCAHARSHAHARTGTHTHTNKHARDAAAAWAGKGFLWARAPRAPLVPARLESQTFGPARVPGECGFKTRPAPTCLGALRSPCLRAAALRPRAICQRGSARGELQGTRHAMRARGIISVAARKANCRAREARRVPAVSRVPRRRWNFDVASQHAPACKQGAPIAVSRVRG